MKLKSPIIFLIAIILIAFLFDACSTKNNALDVSNIDKTTKPAVDFYQFANGNWLKKSTIPASESSWGVFGELRDENKQRLQKILEEVSAKSNYEFGSDEQKIGDFYKTAMDSNGIEERGLSEIQGYFDNINSISSKSDLLDLISNHQKLGVSSVFATFVMGDLMDSKIYAAYIYQGGIGLPDRDYYFDKSQKFVNYRKEYLSHLSKMFMLLGDEEKIAFNKSETVFEIEKRLAGASRTRVELRDYAKMYNKMTPEKANKITPNINWNDHFKKLGAEKLDYLIVAQPEFFKEVNSMINEISLNDWKTYLQWKLISDVAEYLPERFVKENFHFYSNVLSGAEEMKPRWKKAAEQTDGLLGELLGKIYVKKYFPPEAKKKANEMVNNLRKAFAERIKKLDWMGEETKTNALHKLEKFTQKIGYPDKWKDYSKLEIKNDSYIKNIFRITEFENEKDIKKIGKDVDKTEWGMTPATVNAYYSPINNEIVFPAGILQPPYFNAEADDALNYGAMGAVIGHEITHGFDDTGSKFDSDGNMQNWWTDEDRAEFEKRTEKIVDQYSGYVVLDSFNVNGKLTIGENIADFGGLAVAFDALQIALEKSGMTEKIDGYTPEQRFFISWATAWRSLYKDDALLRRIKTDPHSPGMFRAIGPLTNMQEFFSAFDVKAEDSMRRPDSLLIKVW